jgi:hypothetical protein
MPGNKPGEIKKSIEKMKYRNRVIADDPHGSFNFERALLQQSFLR